jgi:hypothetical protein
MPELLNVRVSNVLFTEPVIVDVALGEMLVTPPPLIVPPDQIAEPVIETVSEPIRVPLLRTNEVDWMVSPLLRSTVPPFTVSDSPTLTTFAAPVKFTVAELSTVVLLPGPETWYMPV